MDVSRRLAVMPSVCKLYIVYLMMMAMNRYVAANRNTATILNSMLDNYDKRLRPYGVTGEGSSQNVTSEEAPVRVRLEIYIESIDSIKESTMDFSVTMYLRMFWQDSRLAFDSNKSVVLNSRGMESIWLPDVYFMYEKDAKHHEVTQANMLLRVEPNGDIAYSARLSVTVACNMQLKKFPMDSQKCSIVMSSYAYRTDEVVLYADNSSIIIEKGILISKFTLNNWEAENGMLQFTLGNFSSVKCHFYFSRQMESFLLTVYIPTVLLVTIAWLSFWIDAKAAPARVALGITTVLTVTTMTSGIQESLPVVTYAKAIDIWLVVCLIFVFFSLLEYGMANYLLFAQTGTDETMSSPYEATKSEDPDNPGPKALTRRKHLTAHQLDRYARWIYPLSFFLFSICYWIIFLTI